MTKTEFEEDIRAHLREQYARYPSMQACDAVKFVFQAMLGVGHLLSSRAAVTEFIARETECVNPDPSEPLCEALSPSWCRLNLRRAKEEGISPDTVAGLMFSSQPAMRFTRQDVLETCERLLPDLNESFRDLELFSSILDESRLPSHSENYKAHCHPAYRVIPADWLPYMEAVKRISQKCERAKRLLITLDGPCASGKTVLAEKLSEVFRAAVVHTDDYVMPHAQKTPERLAIPGGNCDDTRLENEVAAPWKRGETVRVRKYDCSSDAFLPEEALAESTVLIIEGCYSSLPSVRKHADESFFLNAPWPIREERLRRRESPSSLKMFYERWIPLEDAYFKAYRLPDGVKEIVLL